MDGCFTVVVVLVALVLVTAVGHGLWLFLAAVARALRGGSPDRPGRERAAQCPACREAVPPGAERCDVCGLPVRGAVARELCDIDAAERQLRRFLDDGALAPTTHDRLKDECRLARHRLLKRLPAALPWAEEVKEATRQQGDKETRRREDRVSPPPVAAPVPSSPSLPVSPSPPPPVSSSPTRSVGSVLTAFLEERNILWGEVVGGLLIVGCSVALVISLWEALESIPYFPFLLFAGITAALFGAGLYTLHRWKLHSTSRGLLAVALLLVPLDFLVLAGLAHGDFGVVEVAVQAAALAGFGALASLAARDLVPGQRGAVTASLVGCAGTELLVPQLLDPSQPGAWPAPLAWLAVACFAIPCGAAFVRATVGPLLSHRAARELLALVGLATFALAAALGLVVFRGGGTGDAFGALALPLVLAAAPVLAAGLLIYRAPDGDGTDQGVGAPLRTAGTAVALAALVVMLAAAVLAWPRPLTMLAVGLLEFAVLTAVALKYRVPLVHAVALPALAVAYLTGFHLLTGNLDLSTTQAGERLLHLAVSPASGSSLIALVVALAAFSEMFVRRARRLDALAYAAAAGAAAVFSLLLTLPREVGAAGRTAITCGVYGVLGVALNVRWRRPALLVTGQFLLAGAMLFGVTWGLAQRPWVGGDAAGLTDARSVQAYGIGLAALTLAWILLRVAGWWSAVARSLVQGDDPPPHRVLLAGLVVLALWLAVWGAFPGIIAELTPASRGAAGAEAGPNALAYGPGGWLLLVAVTGVLLAALWEWPAGAVPGLAAVAVTGTLLAAGSFAEDRATASALRWGLAIVFLAGSAALWLRAHLARLVPRVGIALDPDPPSPEWVRAILLALAAVPVLALTLSVALVGFAGQRPGGPDPESFFAHLGWVASNVVPLAIVSAALVGHGIREGTPGYVLAAGLIADAALAGGYALHQALGGGLDAEDGVHAVQLAAGGAALWALAWMLAGRRLDDAGGRAARPLMGVLAGLSAAGTVVLVALPLLRLLFDPGALLPPSLAAVGDSAGWLALLLGSAAVLGQVGQSSLDARVHVLAVSGVCAGVLAACLVSPWDSGNWLSYHVLLAACGTIGGAVIAVALGGPSLLGADFPARPVSRWAEALGVALALLALRGAWEDPGRPYWPAAAAVSACAVGVALALWLCQPRYVAATGVLAGLVGFIVWLAHGTDTTASFLETQVICLALASGFWSAAELLLRRTGAPIDLRGATRGFCDGAGWLALGLLAVIVTVSLGAGLAEPGAAPGLLPWAALLVLSASFVPTAYDADVRLPGPQLYAAGLLAVGLTLASLGAAPEHVGQVAALLLGGYVLLASVAQASRLWGQATGETPVPRRWFLPAQAVVGGIVVMLSVWTSCHFGAPIDRLAGPGAVALLTGAAVILAERRFALPKPQLLLRYVALSLGVVVLAECGWSFLDAQAAPWMHRSVVLVAALALATIAYGLLLARRAGQVAWAECGRRLGPVLGAAALGVLFVVLAQEFLMYDPAPDVRRTPMAAWAVAVVAAALVGLMAAQVYFAVRPERDPFRLSEGRRTLYVYAAEVLFLGLFVHVRLNAPWLFGGGFVQWWTFLVMGVAFAGVGLAEFFRRRGLPVLAGPLHRTGVFLPLLPLLVFWVRPPLALHDFLLEHAPGTEPLLKALDRMPAWTVRSEFARYSLLWLLLGVLYAATALARRSSRYALLAALAVNAGLWCLLYHYGWAFLAHPQLWLVPLALIVLVAEYLNRERLNPAQAAALRYAGLGGLYLSSTADMFIDGLGHSVALPLVLALLSVLGVFAGIALRVRAFLLLGVGFLGVVVFAMIWHAAVDLAQTWLWWASGIALGAAILALFALFEKRREDVLRVVEEVKNWE
ncbi:MAG TPA: hypothetical protein VKA46_36505 [Gemmataceae bacterium]|nr:hypothetical protein [Gemmataceae bacterium]